VTDIDHRIHLAELYGPHDPLTVVAHRTTVFVCGILGILLFPIKIITTGVGGCLIALTLGLFAIFLTVVWLPILALLLGTSWLWINVWPLRPILLVPGVLFAILANVFVQLAPEPDPAAKYSKAVLAGDWPLTWYLLIDIPPGAVAAQPDVLPTGQIPGVPVVRRLSSEEEAEAEATKLIEFFLQRVPCEECRDELDHESGGRTRMVMLLSATDFPYQALDYLLEQHYRDHSRDKR
jgi:hypothetical protein